MVLKKKYYIILILHYIATLFIYIIMSFFEVYNDVFIPVTILTLTLTLIFVTNLLMQYPIERFNPFLVLSLIYTIQFSISIISAHFNKIVVWDELLRYNDFITSNNILNALMFTYFFSLLTLIFSYFFSMTKLWSNAQQFVKIALLKERVSISLFAIIITFVELLLIVTGQVTLQGESLLNKDLENMQVHPAVAIINPIACVAVFICSYLYAQSHQKKWTLLLFIQFIWFFFWGRRNIVYFVLLLFLGYFFEKKIKIYFINFKRFKNAITVSLLLGFVLVAANFYNQLRVVGGVEILQTLSFKSLIEVAKVYTESDVKELKLENSYNLEIRPLSTTAAIARYDKLLSSGSINLGYGLEFYNSILKAAPSDYIVKNKASIPLMEPLCYILTNGAISEKEDIGDSLIIEGMIDFGYVGIFIYPVILLFVTYSAFSFFLFFKNSIVMLFFVITIFFTMLTMAEGGIGVLFLALRSN